MADESRRQSDAVTPAASSGGAAAERHRSMAAEGPIPSELRAELLLRLARVEGQVRGLARMVEANRRAPEILAQVGAVHRALDGSARLLTRAYLERAATHAIDTGDGSAYDELMDVIYRYR
ncbi:metal-sensitive transcriptional regulator [Parafrankia sp. FMc6]|uniref:metal-sensitive transcriptional regulator n=1 Tax=Parafrankia soli TaxID=2599596 RepID=UPI0034D745CF